jgi:peptidoglycan hydrolase CwlO-like protein
LFENRFNQEEKEKIQKEIKSFDAELNLLNSEFRQKAANINAAKVKIKMKKARMENATGFKNI